MSIVKVIKGCEGRQDADSAYLTRITLLNILGCKLVLHYFHRSDGVEMHDHPWSFTSLILWRGYYEETPTSKKRVYPGMILFRKAEWTHRVELVDGKSAITLVFMGRAMRLWGFYTAKGWQDWIAYFKENGCSK